MVAVADEVAKASVEGAALTESFGRVEAPA
jgi:hypothetical protein